MKSCLSNENQILKKYRRPKKSMMRFNVFIGGKKIMNSPLIFENLELIFKKLQKLIKTIQTNGFFFKL